MNKWLFWALVGVGLWVFLMSVAKKNKRKDQAEQQQEKANREAREGTVVKPLSMKECAHCGVHLVQGDTVLRHGQFFCSEAHAKLGAK